MLRSAIGNPVYQDVDDPANERDHSGDSEEDHAWTSTTSDSILEECFLYFRIMAIGGAASRLRFICGGSATGAPVVRGTCRWPLAGGDGVRKFAGGGGVVGIAWKSLVAFGE